MKTWTPDASAHFENWLARARVSVAGDPSVNPDDVAQDLRAHVHAELQEGPEPVTVGALDRVLDGLGNPTQWGDGVSEPAVSRAARFERDVMSVVTGWQQKLAGDWGAPVLLALLTIIAIGTFNWVGFPLMILAYFVARSHVTYAPHTLVGRKRWLVYFPLAIGAGLLTGLVLSFPMMFRGTWQSVSDLYEMLWLLGGWWMLVGFLAAREPKRVRSALRPFADGFDVTHGRMLALIGSAFLIAASVILISN